MVIIYHLLAAVDSILFGLASEMFRIIYEIATTDFFRPEQITDVANRVYVVVGVLMLFKLVIAAIQYMINPDTFDDKEKGMGGLLQKLVISLLLIVVVPSVFNFLISIQRPIIRTLPSIILGNNASEFTDKESIGFDLSFQVLQAFVRARDGKGGSVGENGEIHDIGTFNAHITDGCPLFSFFGAISTDNCEYDYMIIVSTLGGAFLCYVLLSMILDIAIRTIKFGIIQILAPIPISSYVFSKDKLSKFAKTAMTVYTDLFVRMAIVYFVIFAIREMVIKNNLLNVLSINGGGVSDTGNWFRGVIVNVALIFGLLMFASKAPKFITELLGLPDVGSGDMADMFKPAWQRIGGFNTPGAMIGAFRNSREYGEDEAKGHKIPRTALRRALAAGGHATATRLKDIASGKSLEESYKSTRDAAFARTNKNLEYANRYPNFWERQKQKRNERFDAYTGVMTGGKKASATIEAANRAINARNKAWSRAQDKVGEHADWYNGGFATDSRGNKLDFDQMYALFEKDGTEMWKGQKVDLAKQYQEIKDRASVDFLTQSFAYTDHGDAQARNEFSENIYSIIRSGADKQTVERLLTIDMGDGKKMFAGDVAARVEKMNKALEGITDKDEIKRKMKELTDANIAFTASEARAIAEFAKNLNKTGGNVRLEATKTQTTAPKDS